ncbi:nucleolar protein 11-like isoform X2 [Amphiura filiformis]|uniref:nucleolar protein 11-like isoform X2 n=1 Tax=Amphiura filiformis TaxID=82378 RepID=UPI003B223172
MTCEESETKPCNIWTSKPNQHFSCAAISDISTHQYAACINNKLVIWDDSVPDITKVKPLVTMGTIQRLYPLDADGGCVMLYSNGAVYTTKMEQLLESVTEEQQGLLKPGEVIMDSHVWTSDGEGMYVVCLVEHTKQHSLFFTRIPGMNKSAEQVIRVSIDSPSKLLHTSFHTTNSQMVMHAVGKSQYE